MLLSTSDRFGFLHPSVDVHTLGINSIEQLLAECGIMARRASPEINEAANRAADPASARALRDWIKGNGITAIGFSYRLDPEDGLRLFSAFVDALMLSRSFVAEGGTIKALFFAGLPKTCDLVEGRFPVVAGLFRGDESPAETLDILCLPRRLLPKQVAQGAAYDDARMAFGRELVRKGEYQAIGPVDRSGYRRFGQRGDSIAARVAHGAANGLPPVMRAHVGPYLPDRKDAVALFADWTGRLARAGFLDVLSIGSSQLSQAEFGGDWEGKSDGGGVPLNSAQEFAEAWRAARPMLVRSYAGTRDVLSMAQMLEENIDIAWHALSLWWFCEIDGRGPNPVLENLRQHLETLKFIASTEKPFEPNVPHHFGFRGGDDLTYVLSGFIAAKAAKTAGIQKLILQVMLNTPRSTWGIGDLAKARALLHLVRELEDSDFKVYLQPRGGLDYFSRDADKAKAQLAAVTAMMEDIEPNDASSPAIIHVVSYSEGFALADPDVVNESVRITRHALSEYRVLREAGAIEDMSSNPQVLVRASELLRDAREAVAAIESSIQRPYSAEGLYEILASGFFATPDLMHCREEFAEAVKWRTRSVNGAIVVVDEAGALIPAKERIAVAAETAKSRTAAKGGRSHGQQG
jgi:hypothetical protein